MRERCLVVNADDFGLAPGISQGIIEGHATGVITSTSVMVTFDDWTDTVARIHAAPRSLGMGLHLDLLAGTPLVPGSPFANGTTGAFDGVGGLLKRIASGRIRRADVQVECEAQIARLRAALSVCGATITHLDSHRHVHVLPVVADGVAAAARNAGIRVVRSPRETLDTTGPVGARVRRRILRLLAGARTTEVAFIGTTWQGDGRFAEHLRSVPSVIGPGVTELMCHPGHVDDVLRARDAFTAEREAELSALREPGLREAWQVAGVRLANFSALAGRDAIAE